MKNQPLGEDHFLKVPGWASGVDEAQFKRFVLLVDSYLKQRGFNHTLREDGHYDSEDDLQPLEIVSLLHSCIPVEAPRWPIHISRTLGPILTKRANRQQARALLNYDVAAPLLRLKLWPERALTDSSDGAAEVALSAFLPGLAKGLALQLSGRLAPVAPVDLEHWNVDPTAVYQRALRNVKAAGLMPVRRHPLSAAGVELPGVIHALFEGGPLVSTHGLFASAYLSEALTYGALVVIPHDRAAVFHAIVDGPSLHAAVTTMARFAQHTHDNAPRPLSPLLYWWHEGAVEMLPVEHEREGMIFSPPPSFVEAVLRPLDALTSPGR